VSVTFFRLDRQRIERALRAYVQALAGDPEVLAVVLFGSLARGEATAMSDADVLLILARSSKPFHARIPDYLRGGIGISMDVFPYTLAEAQRMLGEGTGVVPVALREGIWLLDRARVREGLLGQQATQAAVSAQDER
jgi:predicted nucleotidyltransferase